MDWGWGFGKKCGILLIVLLSIDANPMGSKCPKNKIEHEKKKKKFEKIREIENCKLRVRILISFIANKIFKKCEKKKMNKKKKTFKKEKLNF